MLSPETVFKPQKLQVHFALNLLKTLKLIWSWKSAIGLLYWLWPGNNGASHLYSIHVPVVSTSENQDLLVTEIYRFLILNTLSQNDPTLIIYRNEFLLAPVSYVYTVLKVKGYNVATKFQRLSFEERQI